MFHLSSRKVREKEEVRLRRIENRRRWNIEFIHLSIWTIELKVLSHLSIKWDFFFIFSICYLLLLLLAVLHSILESYQCSCVCVCVRKCASIGFCSFRIELQGIERNLSLALIRKWAWENFLKIHYSSHDTISNSWKAKSFTSLGRILLQVSIHCTGDGADGKECIDIVEMLLMFMQL